MMPLWILVRMLILLYEQDLPPQSLNPFENLPDSTIIAAVRGEEAEPPVDPSWQKRRILQEAFGVGEKLVFDIAYGPIVAGEAIMSIPDTVMYRGQACYRVLTTARSTKFVDTFFKVRDRVETLIDTEGIFPWRFEKRIREGKYRSHRKEIYDQSSERVYYKKDTIDVAPYIQGVLSSFYFVRTMDLEVGKHFDIDNFGDGKIYPLRILVHKKEKVRVPAGTFKCILVEPILKEEGIFKHEGRLRIWLTDDAYRMPVLMKSKALIGSIDVRLTRYNRHRK